MESPERRLIIRAPRKTKLAPPERRHARQICCATDTLLPYRRGYFNRRLYTRWPHAPNGSPLGRISWQIERNSASGGRPAGFFHPSPGKLYIYTTRNIYLLAGLRFRLLGLLYIHLYTIAPFCRFAHCGELGRVMYIAGVNARVNLDLWGRLSRSICLIIIPEEGFLYGRQVWFVGEFLCGSLFHAFLISVN